MHRRGTFDLPVVLEAKFDDGSTVRERWDGKDRWHRFAWDRKTKLVSAEVDPDHGYLLDRDPFNNSWTAKARSQGKQQNRRILDAADAMAGTGVELVGVKLGSGERRDEWKCSQFGRIGLASSAPGVVDFRGEPVAGVAQLAAGTRHAEHGAGPQPGIGQTGHGI